MRILTAMLAGLLLAGVAEAWEDDSLIPIQTIMLEAGNQSLEGQIAVGEVIRNRALRGDLSPESVCLARRQFSCWNDRKQAKKRLSRASGETFQRASRAWAESEHSQLVGESTHYHTVDVLPYWAKGHKPAYRIGRHLFYEGIK